MLIDKKFLPVTMILIVYNNYRFSNLFTKFNVVEYNLYFLKDWSYRVPSIKKSYIYIYIYEYDWTH